MTDVNANIKVNINSDAAISSLRKLQAEVTAFNESVIRSNAAAAASQKQLNSQLIAQIGAVKNFSTSITNVESGVTRLGRSIDKNRLSLGEYFKYGVGASRTFGKVFAREHNDVMALAEERVKRLQTQYVGLGQAQNGVVRALAARPLQLFNADSAISIQRQQLFNKLLHDGSTALVNWGKNTQWAGRQLMVGFTLPITMFGTVAGKVFMDLEKQTINFQRVYGDLGTTVEESEAMAKQVQALGKEYTKYGIAVQDTIGLAAKAAAAGAQGVDLIAATEQATRLSTLGQIDQNQALTATIALQSAFNIGAGELASTIDFLNAVENQTVVSLDDITVAIPKVAPVIKGLGGDVKDLSVFLAAMREGGVNAAEGANALKSGLASLINPTKNASEMLKRAGINMDDLIKKNKGDLMGLVQDFGAELQNLDKFSRQQVLAKVFGKYQFARMGALFENINKDGSQAQRVLQLSGESMQDLAALSEKELGKIEQAVSTKFLASVEKMKLAIAPIGELFLKIATPVVEFLTKIIEKFNSLPEGAKNFIVIGTAISAVLIPSVIMLVGLLANFLGNMMKIGLAFRSFIGRIRGGGDAFQYYENQELDAMAAAASLEGKVTSLTGEINVQRSSVLKLANAYETMALAARSAATMLPQGFRPMGRNIRMTRVRTMAKGGVVGGKGNEDSEPALLMPGEFVMNKEASEKYGPILAAMNEGTIAKYALGRTPITARGTSGERTVMVDIKGQSQLEAINARLAKAEQKGPEVVERVLDILERFGERVDSVTNQIDPEIRSAGISGVASETKYSAPKWIATQTEQMGNWESKQSEIEAIQQSVVDKWEVTDSQMDNLIKTQASHLVVIDENGNRIEKSWEDVANLTPDLGAINNYLNRTERMTFDMGQDSEIIQRIMSETSMSYSDVLDEVTKLRQGAHPTTVASLKVLKSLGQIDEELSLFELEMARARGLSKTQMRELETSLGVKAVSGYQATGAVAGATTRMSYEQQNPQAGFYATMPQRTYAGRGVEEAQNTAEEVLDVTRRVWRIQSPSEAEADIAEEVPRGAALGITRTTPQAVEAAKEMAQKVVTTTENTFDTLSMQELQNKLSAVPAEGRAAQMARIGSYGGDPTRIVDVVSQGNAEMQKEVARLRSLQVEEKAILARIIEMENAELAQRKVALQAAILRKQQATEAATTGMAQAKVQATTAGTKTIPITGQGAGGTAGLGGKPMPVANAGEIITDQQTNNTVKRFDRIKTSIAGIAPKLAGVSVAASLAAGAFAGMEGPVGEFASKIFPLLGFLDLITIPLTLIGPAGVSAGAGMEAAGAGATAAGAGMSSMLGPITAIVAGLALLVAAFKVTYDRFEPLRIAVDGLIKTVTNLVGMVVGELIGAFKQLFGITNQGKGSMASFGDILQSVASFLGPIFTTYIQAITKWITILANAIRVVIKVFQMFFSIIRMVGSIIVGLLGKAIENILNGLGPFGEKLKEIASTVSSAFGSIGTVIAGIFGKIPSLIESAINIAIKGINALIDRFNDLPDWVRLGQRISNIDEFNFAGATQGAAPTEGQKPLQQMNANAFMAKTRYVKPEEQGEELLPEDTGGAGEKQKSWLEQLIETTNANYDLFVGGMSKAKNSMMDKLRKAIPNLPEQLVEAIGEGPEALNNIKALLSMNTKKRNNLIRKMIQTSTSKTVQDALDAAAKARRQKMVAGEAEAVLLSRGFSPEAAKEIAGNADFAFSIVQARAGKTKESLDQVIDAARGISEEMNNMATASDQLGWLNELMEMQQIQHDQEMKSIDDQIEAYKDQIAVIQEEIDAIEKLNDQDKDRISNLERQKEMISRQIEQLERANELDQRKIESLKREDELRNRVAEALGQELDQMSKQEDAIRKAYDERIKALDTVAKINDHIIQQQRSQISLSQALSQGDIYAAAQAQQEMQAQQIQFATEQQRTGLQQGMENQIAGLRTEGGLTREQAEQQIAAIKEQSYQTSLAIRDIEDQIYQRNQEMIPLKDQQYNLDRQIRDIQDTIYNREKQIKDIQDQRIAPLQTALDKQQKIKEQKEDEFAAQVESQKALIDQARLTDLQLSNTAKLGKNWRKVAEQIVAANNAMKNDLLELGPAPEWDQTSGETYAEFQARLDAYNAARNEIIGKRNTTVNTEMKNAPSTATTMNTGGLVSGNGSRDSIAARLTPGEFVMRKAAVNKYGKPLFQKMNMGSIDMPRYRTQAGTAFGSVSSANDAARNAAVYNTYSINVPVNQPGASADEIANKVMMKIKNIDNSSIRRINGY